MGWGLGGGSRVKPAQAPSRTTWVSPGGHRASGAGAWQEAAALSLCQADPAAKTRSRGQAEGNVTMQIMRPTEPDTDRLPRQEFAASG